MAIRKVTLGLVVAVFSSLTFAQYSSTYTNPTQDVTSLVTSGTNAWQPLPSGGPACKPGSASLPGYNHVWCVGIDGYPYEYVPKTRTWTKQTNMGTAASKMIVQDSGHVYSLHTLSDCTQYAPDQAFMKWNGIWEEVEHGACWSEVSVGRDGFMAAITKAPGTDQNTMWVSTTGGTSWGPQWKPAGISTWTSVNMFNQNTGCAVTAAGVAYEVSYASGASSTSLGNPSSHPLVGCVNFPYDQDVIVAYDGTGAVWISLSDNTGWHSVKGLTVDQVVGSGKGNIVALNTAGQPYHLNLKPVSLTVTVSGTWNAGCPGSLACDPGATHTLNKQVRFHSGHGMYGGKSSYTMQWNTYGSTSSFDTSLFCDPFYSDLTGAECLIDVGGDDMCNQSGAVLGTSDPLYGEGEGNWYVQYTKSAPVVYGPLTNPFPGVWSEFVTIPVVDNCVIGTPTCRGGFPQVNENPPIWDMVIEVRGYDPLEVEVDASSLPFSSPKYGWVVESYYQTDPYLVPQCDLKDIRPADQADDGACD